ncbi:MerR family transcriptional regulator [Erysipelothrix aquatica]|uniref:MerR family transcriptional regulator n=1 Tax=Erysipelothrix aquatica TaxID=2683714 RepID=UPI00135BB01A|nr:MerR family transcriptional regulator [Erysipelothrix aquatica]
MERLFMITEVAQLHSISKKTLLYYDRIGLFVPKQIDEDTGYRYYVREQFPYLKQIIYLKDLGFTLVEIGELLENRNMTMLITELERRLQEVTLEMEALRRKKDDLRYLLDFYKQADLVDERDLYRPNIKFFKDREFAVEYANPEEKSLGVMLAYRRILKTLNTLNKFSQMPYGTVSVQDDNNKSEMYAKIGAFIELPESIENIDKIYAEGGKYACMYKKGGYFDEKSVQMLSDWCLENGYQPIGNFYDFSLIDYTFVNADAEMIQEIQVRIV